MAEPFKIPDISALADEQLTELVTTIRVNRLNLYRAYQETLRLKEEHKEAKVREQIQKQLNIWERELNRLDKALEKATDRGNKVLALMLSVGMDTGAITAVMDILHGEEK